jgi:hypothetical protein
MRYFLRALKHFVKMVALIAIIYLLMYATDTLAVNQQELLGTKGIILLVALVALSAAYPSYGFVERTIEGSIAEDRDIILETMARGGYSLGKESDQVISFRASGPLQRLLAMGDDEVCIRQIAPNKLLLSGLRKSTVESEFRLSGRMRIKREQEGQTK